MTDPLFMVGAFVLIGGLAILYGHKRTKTNAAIAAADAASLAAYQRQLDATAIWMRDHRDRGEPPKMICDAVPAGFDHDEQILCVLPGVDLMELRAVRHSIRRGRAYGGPTIQLTRGLSVQLGASSSTGHSVSESFDELRQIDNGTLVLTTKRLAFLGSLRTYNSSLDDLIGVKDVGEGIQVHREQAEGRDLSAYISADRRWSRDHWRDDHDGDRDGEARPRSGCLGSCPATGPGRMERMPFLENRGSPLQFGSLHE